MESVVIPDSLTCWLSLCRPSPPDSSPGPPTELPWVLWLGTWEGDDPECADDQQNEGDGKHCDSWPKPLESLSEGGQKEYRRQEDSYFHIMITGFPCVYGPFEVLLRLLGKLPGILSVCIRVLRHEDGPGRRGEVVQQIELLSGQECCGVFGTKPMLVGCGEFFITGSLSRDPTIESRDVIQTILAC